MTFSSLAVAILLLSASEECPLLHTVQEARLPVSGCPTVHVVREVQDPGAALNLVFIGQGFLEDELDKYRCAVELLVDRLLDHPPFSTHNCRINAYRLDIATTENDLSLARCDTLGRICVHLDPDWPDNTMRLQCPGRAFELRIPVEAARRRGEHMEQEPPPPPPEVELLLSAWPHSCLTSSLGVQYCWGGGEGCGVFGTAPGGLKRAWKLASCAPNPSAVILLADTKEGGSVWRSEGEQAAVIVSLKAISDPDGRAASLAHELAHTLGLFDELPYSSGTVDYQPRQNLWRSDSDLEAVPRWNALCPGPGDPQSEHRCKFRCNPEDSGEVTTGEDGQVIPVPLCGCSVNPGDQDPAIGRWQGAFYQHCDYYRSQKGCHMYELNAPPNLKDQDPAVYFCPACKGALHDFFLGAGLPPCDDLPIGAAHILLGDKPRGIRIQIPAGSYFPSGVVQDPRFGSTSLKAEALLWPLGRFRAFGYLEGAEYTVDLEEVEATLVARDPVHPPHSLKIRWLPGAIYDRLQWSIDGELVTSELLEQVSVDQLVEFLETRDVENIRAKVRYQEEELEPNSVEIILWDAPDYSEKFLEPVYRVPAEEEPEP